MVSDDITLSEDALYYSISATSSKVCESETRKYIHTYISRVETSFFDQVLPYKKHKLLATLNTLVRLGSAHLAKMNC